MEQVKKDGRGRKKIDPSLRVKACTIYIKDGERNAIIEKYGSITNAVREEVLQKLETTKLANL